MNPTSVNKMKNKVSTIYDYLEELKSFSFQNYEYSGFVVTRILGSQLPQEGKDPEAEKELISGILNSIIESLSDIKSTLLKTRERLEEVKKEIE